MQVLEDDILKKIKQEQIKIEQDQPFSQESEESEE